jgi:hypothetical protein
MSVFLYIVFSGLIIIVVQFCCRRELIEYVPSPEVIQDRVIVSFNLDTLEHYYDIKQKEFENDNNLNRDFVLFIPSKWKFWADVYVEFEKNHSMYEKAINDQFAEKIANDFPDDFELELENEEEKIYRLYLKNVEDNFVNIPVWFIYEMIDKGYLPQD